MSQAHWDSVYISDEDIETEPTERDDDLDQGGEGSQDTGDEG